MGFKSGKQLAQCILGTTFVEFGSSDKGLALIEQGLNAYQHLKAPPVFWPMLLYLGAGAYSAAAEPEAGLRMMNEAIEVGSPKGTADNAHVRVPHPKGGASPSAVI